MSFSLHVSIWRCCLPAVFFTLLLASCATAEPERIEEQRLQQRAFHDQLYFAEILLDIAEQDREKAIEIMARYFDCRNEESQLRMGLSSYLEGERYHYFLGVSGNESSTAPAFHYQFEGSFIPVHDYKKYAEETAPAAGGPPLDQRGAWGY